MTYINNLGRNWMYYLFLILIVLFFIVFIFIFTSYPNTDDARDVFYGKVYGDVITRGFIHGNVTLTRSVQIYFFYNGDPLVLLIENVSRISILENDTIIYDNEPINGSLVRIDFSKDGMVTLPITTLSLEYELSAFNCTSLENDYLTDIDISHLDGIGTLDLKSISDPLFVFDGTVYFNNESFNSSAYTISLIGSEDNHITVNGEGDIDLYYIPPVIINGELILYDCIEVDSQGRRIAHHDMKRFQGKNIRVITIANPEYIDDNGGYVDPWIIKVYTT